MHEISSKNEVLLRNTGKPKDLKAKERNLIKELFEKKKEASVQERLKKEIRQFESIGRKEMVDYSMFIIKLQSIKDGLEYQRAKSDGDIGNIEKDISKVDALIEKYKKEQFDVCMQRSDAVLSHTQRVLSL